MNSSFVDTFACWCGSKELEEFSPDYRRCEDCGTLVRHPRESDEFYTVRDDAKDFYGKEYWISRTIEGFELSNIFKRSQTDLIERCLYWLTHILRYKQPPGKSLEIGCAHGGFVMLMNMAGFDAVGCEMSPWVVNYASNTFNVPILCGRFEELSLGPSSYDCILLLDVLEHLPNPNDSLRIISSLMKPDSILVIQTPHFRDEHLTYEQMRAGQHIFLQMMKNPGHLFLFTEGGLRQILFRTGLHHIAFEPPLFPYDMFVFAGKESLEKNARNAVDDELLKSPRGRVLAALLDLYEKSRQAEADLAARLQVVQTLEAAAQERLQKLLEALAALEAERERARSLETNLAKVSVLLAEQEEKTPALIQELETIQSDWGYRASNWFRNTFRGR